MSGRLTLGCGGLGPIEGTLLGRRLNGKVGGDRVSRRGAGVDRIGGQSGVGAGLRPWSLGRIDPSLARLVFQLTSKPRAGFCCIASKDGLNCELVFMRLFPGSEERLIRVLAS